MTEKFNSKNDPNNYCTCFLVLNDQTYQQKKKINFKYNAAEKPLHRIDKNWIYLKIL